MNRERGTRNGEPAGLEVGDLVGRAYSETFNCYALVREVVQRGGGTLPATQEEALAGEGHVWERVEGGAPRVLDLVVLGAKGAAQHVGVMLTAWRFIHCTRAGGVRVDELARYERAGEVQLRARLRGAFQ